MFGRLICLKRPPDKSVALGIIYKRYYSQNQAECKETLSEKHKKLPSFISASDGSPIDVTTLPKEIMRRTKKCATLHLLDKCAAKEFSSMVIDDLLKSNSFVAEINPGMGFLTRELLDAGVPFVHAYEKNGEFYSHLNSLVEKYPGRLDLRPYNLLNIGKFEYLDRKVNTKTMSKVFDGLSSKLWTDEPSLTIIGAVPNMRFFYAFTWSLINRFLFDYGRTVFYVAILPSMSMALADCPDIKYFHKPNNIFLRSYFDIKKLGSLPRAAFFPWELAKPWRKRFVAFYMQDSIEIDVMKIEAKVDLFTEDFTRHDIIIFYYFLTIHLKKLNTRIIPTFEKWMPGCGPRIIRENYNIFTAFDDLSSEELFRLFKVLKSWPEYESSVFLNFVETIMENKKEHD